MIPEVPQYSGAFQERLADQLHAEIVQRPLTCDRIEPQDVAGVECSALTRVILDYEKLARQIAAVDGN